MGKGGKNHQNNTRISFSMSDEELEQAIDRYKGQVESGEIIRPNIPHFCSQIGYTEKEVAAVVKRGKEDEQGNANVYTRRSLMLRRFFTWVRGQMFSAEGWGGQMKGLAWSLAGQDFGDEIVYTDKKEEASGPQEVRVVFGGADPRAKRAQK